MTKETGGDGPPAPDESASRPTNGDPAAAEEPAARPSAMELLAGPADYPDDGKLSSTLRAIDHYVGLAMQIGLFVTFGFVVIAGATQAVSTKMFGKSLLWTFDIVRAGTFAIALIGAAFASQQARHLSMDIVSRFVSPHKRLALRIVLGLFTVFAAYLLLESGARLYERVGQEGGHQGIIPMDLIALIIPVGAGLVIFHTFLHLLIDADYLRRGKLPPEKEPTGH